MLRILIMSDSHGRNENVELAIAQVREEIGEFQMLIHLGDVGDAREIESLAGVPCYIVRGNTDYDAKLLNANVIEAGGHRIFATHGHLYQVDMRLDLLRFAALENDCDIAMYGHTHVPYLEEDPDDITILNPGSISKPRQADHRYTYMVMEIDDEDEVTYELRYVE
ncbi:MAG: YfcE family phosphodiesterase [Coprococcus sp.]|jgi:phosphodiesterase family protein